MKEENYLEVIYGCLERIEKKVETLPVEGTSPAAVSYTHLDVYKRQEHYFEGGDFVRFFFFQGFPSDVFKFSTLVLE